MDDSKPPKTAHAVSTDSLRRLLLGLLLAALVIQNVVWPVALRIDGAVWPKAAGIVSVGIAFAQLDLAAVLLIWGTGWPLVRAAVATLLFLGAGYLACRGVGQEQFSVWLGIMLLAMAVVAAPLAIARLAGVVILPTEEPEAPRSSRQFTIWGLLSLTTLVAVLLGVGRLLKFPWGELGAIAVFAIASGAIPWTLAPVSLGRVPWPVTLIVGSTVCPAMGALMAFTGFPPFEPVHLAAMCSVQGMVILVALAVVRVAGYRLVR